MEIGSWSRWDWAMWWLRQLALAIVIAWLLVMTAAALLLSFYAIVRAL